LIELIRGGDCGYVKEDGDEERDDFAEAYVEDCGDLFLLMSLLLFT
jgi:hypothetical protein